MKRSPYKTAKQWAQLISEHNAGTLSEREFCTRHNVKLASLRKWRYHFAAQSPEKSESAPAAFVKVITDTTGSIQQSAVLCIGQDIRLECPASYDIASLAQLALAVHHGR